MEEPMTPTPKLTAPQRAWLTAAYSKYGTHIPWSVYTDLAPDTRVLNALKRMGLIKNDRGDGYHITPAGREALK
jgi:hypothetical protein